MSLLGERGEVVNTSGCEPDIREFDSHRSPQTLKTVKMVVVKTAIFSFFSRKPTKSVIICSFLYHWSKLELISLPLWQTL